MFTCVWWRRASEGKLSNYATDMVRAILIKKETKTVAVKASGLSTSVRMHTLENYYPKYSYKYWVNRRDESWARAKCFCADFVFPGLSHGSIVVDMGPWISTLQSKAVFIRKRMLEHMRRAVLRSSGAVLWFQIARCYRILDMRYYL
ncbi:conserved hypothetical protein [Histoplasma capsulatum H143]|uniref:Uncharacterized protein n=1 Tax=Ajellomyces capsulatus (strain H143) TaxID=544712 RepID=C6H2A8_AJECH|nr:conserved hypothetical protein [Histoplasma capsulatum H143]